MFLESWCHRCDAWIWSQQMLTAGNRTTSSHSPACSTISDGGGISRRRGWCCSYNVSALTTTDNTAAATKAVATAMVIFQQHLPLTSTQPPWQQQQLQQLQQLQKSHVGGETPEKTGLNAKFDDQIGSHWAKTWYSNGLDGYTNKKINSNNGLT